MARRYDPEARTFLDYVRKMFQLYFESKVVLDVGSRDINGNNHGPYLLTSYRDNQAVPTTI